MAKPRAAETADRQGLLIVDGFRGPTYIIAALVVIALAIAAWRYLRGRRVEPSHARPASEREDHRRIR